MHAKTEATNRSGRSRGRPKLEDAAAIESRLLAVALTEFTAHGYGGTSMARIVKAAGVSKTTLYSRFSSKEELFRAIIHRQIDQLAATAQFGAYAGPPDLVEGLRAYANTALKFSQYGQMLEVNRLIYSEAHRFPELGAAMAEATEHGVTHVAGFITECAKADGLPCKDPYAAASVFIFLLRGWHAQNMLRNQNVSRSVRAEWVERTIAALVSDRSNW